MSTAEGKYGTLRRLHEAESRLNFSLEVFGDALAKREEYRSVDGLEAVHYYLIHKFGWLPRDVRAMSHEDLRLVLAEELQGWTLPEEARR